MAIRPKAAKVTSAEQIVKAQDKLVQTQELLVKAQAEIDATNEQLDVVIEVSHGAIASYEKLIENEQDVIRRAITAQEKNNEYKAKLSEVIGLEV